MEMADAPGSDFDHLMAINLRGVWNCMKYELVQMRQRGEGSIVNVSSTNGLIGNAGLGAYTASKHGVIGLTRSAALEYAAKGAFDCLLAVTMSFLKLIHTSRLNVHHMGSGVPLLHRTQGWLPAKRTKLDQPPRKID